MNEHAKKAARRAELESIMIDAWKAGRYTGERFADWLEVERNNTFTKSGEQAIELIALYGEGVL